MLYSNLSCSRTDFYSFEGEYNWIVKEMLHVFWNKQLNDKHIFFKLDIFITSEYTAKKLFPIVCRLRADGQGLYFQTHTCICYWSCCRNGNFKVRETNYSETYLLGIKAYQYYRPCQTAVIVPETT